MINNVASRIKVVHTKALVSPIVPYSEVKTDYGPIETRVSYLNNLPVDITVIDRTGFRHTVKSNLNGSSYAFIIRTEIKIRHDSISEIRKFLSCLDTKFNQTLTVIKEIVLSKSPNETYTGFSIYLDYNVDFEEIKMNNGSLYCKPKDVVLSTSTTYAAPAHPYAEDSVNDFFFPNDSNKTIAGVPVFKIEIIDNNNEIGNRYIYCFGSLHELFPKPDIERQSGIYLTLMETNVLNETGFSLVQKRYSFEEAQETLGIYKTKEEAFSAGDVKLARKEELARLEHENAVIKQEYTTLKANLDTELSKKDHQNKLEILNIQRQMEKLTKEKEEIEHFREMERAVRKEAYESKSIERKDISEIIKFLPFVVMTIGALIAAFNKSNKST